MDHSNMARPRVDIELDQSGALATLRFSGPIRGDDLHRAQRGLHDRLGGRTLSGLLIDARQSQPDYTPGQLADALEACLESASPHRLAFVSGEMREDTVSLIETAAVPYAVRVRGFLDLDEGERWVAGR
ncbi:unnamed protein product [Chrysoparadoxa australica]